MSEKLQEYRPDFVPGNWSERDRHFLEAFATNPDGIVSVLRNRPPEITGALCSRASRASGSLFEVLLKEYIYPIVDGADRELARELEETVQFLKEHGFKNILNNQRAQSLRLRGPPSFAESSQRSCLQPITQSRQPSPLFSILSVPYILVLFL